MNNLQMVMQIKAERQKYERQEVLHNKQLHQQILGAWRRDSPKMYKRLKKLKVLDDLAFVCQERMWQTAEQYREGGMPPTDALEQAEREHLMLEPEQEAEAQEEQEIPRL